MAKIFQENHTGEKCTVLLGKKKDPRNDLHIMYDY
jgi:hypothetical protein